MRLAVLKFAAVLKAPYVDIEFDAAYVFYAGTLPWLGVDLVVVYLMMVGR